MMSCGKMSHILAINFNEQNMYNHHIFTERICDAACFCKKQFSAPN